MPPIKPGGDSDQSAFGLTQPADSPPVDDVSAEVPAPTDDVPSEDGVKLRLVGAFGDGDTFAVAKDEKLYVIGTQPTRVPASVVEFIVDSARDSGLQIENLSVDDTSKED